MWTETARRIGLWSSVVVVILSLVYVAVGAVWLFGDNDFALAHGLKPSQPYLTILEILLFLSTPAILAVFAAIHAYARPEKKVYSLIAFGFTLMLVAVTDIVRFLTWTVGRRNTSENLREVLTFYTPDGSMSVLLAIDLLAWDLFFGLAMVAAAIVFSGDRLHNAVRAVFLTAGLLCLIGFSGPATGDLRLQGPAIIGYAFVFPFACFLLSLLFSRPVRPSESNGWTNEPFKN